MVDRSLPSFQKRKFFTILPSIEKWKEICMQRVRLIYPSEVKRCYDPEMVSPKARSLIRYPNSSQHRYHELITLP